MTLLLSEFNATARKIRDNISLAESLQTQFTALDLSDILRAQIVFSLSALDLYIHEIVRMKMSEILKGFRTPTTNFNSYQIPMAIAAEWQQGTISQDWLDAVVREKHGHLTFQMPDKISAAVKIISDVELWKEVGLHLGEDPKDIKTQLKLYVSRRNKIAHELDLQPTIPYSRWPIASTDARSCIDFIEKIVLAIDHVIR